VSTAVPQPRASARVFWGVNAAISAAVLAFLAWLFFVHPVDRASGGGVRALPAVNAMLNATSACLLVVGRVAIARRARRAHAVAMVSAFVTSALFFVSYVTYHYAHGDTRFAGTGGVRTVYLLVLASHVLLSIAVVPLALAALYFAYRAAFRTHTKITRVLWPIWLYVSVTGVVIYFMLRDSYAGVLP
jgi:putative membrane protein